ncbi:MAG TPA: class I SAM-dependent methyltransferase [Tepidisphaeraceae bacterium]
MRFGLGHIVVGCLIGTALLVAALVLVPMLLRSLLGVKVAAPARWQDRVELRYQNQGTYVWLFAWFKLRLDPMFRELPEFLKGFPQPRVAMDLGCGHGIAGCSLVEWFTGLKLYGMDPDFDRVRAASRALGDRGRVFSAGAPDFESPMLPDELDMVFALDMVHFLSDSELELSLRRIRARLKNGGSLFLRAPMQPAGIGSLLWNVDKISRRISGIEAYFRSVDAIRAAIEKAGFRISRVQMSGENKELYWFVASAYSAKPVIQENGAEQKHGDDVREDQGEQVPLAEFIPPL